MGPRITKLETALLRVPLKQRTITDSQSSVDAVEFLLLGATTIQVTTGIMHYGYGIVRDMCEGLED